MITFIRKPVDGSLPFINADGHGIVEVARTLKRFSAIVNGGEVADTVRLHPDQASRAFTPTAQGTGLRPVPRDCGGLTCIEDLSLLPNEGRLYLGEKLLGEIRNLAPANVTQFPLAMDMKVAMHSRLEQAIEAHKLYLEFLKEQKDPAAGVAEMIAAQEQAIESLSIRLDSLGLNG